MSDVQVDWNRVKAEISDFIEEIKHTSLNVNMEVCGNWVWISGDTFFHAKLLRSLGCDFSKAKKMWFFVPPSLPASVKKSDRSFSIAEIRTHYGSEVLKKASAQTREAKKSNQGKSYKKPVAESSFLSKLFLLFTVIYS